MRSGSFVAVVLAAVVAGSSACSGRAPEPSEEVPHVEEQASDTSQPPVQVRTSINRTAVWVGDPIVWTVELICAPTVDVIADDLAADKLELTALDFVRAETERTTSADGVLTHRVHYHLRTFEIGSAVLRTASLSVRYFIRRPGQRVEDMTPAGEVQVPGALLAWRSTVPAGLQAIDLREGRPTEDLPMALRVARWVGLGLLLVSIAPAALWVASRLRKVSLPRARRLTARVIREETRSTLERLRATDTSTSTARREAYAQLSAALRRYVAETASLPALALTPEEVAERCRRPGSRLPGEALAEVLAECDRARYGRAEVVHASDQFLNSVAAAERLI